MSTSYENHALWIRNRGGRLEPGPAPYTPPGRGEVTVRVRAVALNPVDAIPLWRLSGLAYRLFMPWLTFPTVIGTDVAGEVVEVGDGVTRLRPGDRVLGMAAGQERSRNRAAEGAFQHYTVLLEQLVSPIPDDVSFSRAAVLPLTLSTAATALFQQDHLALPLPSSDPPDRGQAVFVWGGASSVGSNAIQLAHCSGYRVVTTCSPHNVDYVRSRGADAAVDYHDAHAVDEIIAAIDGTPLAGAFAVTRRSVRATIDVAARAPGTARVASAQTAVLTRVQALRSSHRNVPVTAIWGGSLKDNEVGPGIYESFLPDALSSGTFRPAPAPTVVGDGLDRIPAALARLSEGVSATKLVVRL